MPGIEPGDSVALSGRWVMHPSFGRQLEVKRAELRIPTGREGLIKFLGSGRIKGVGVRTAEKIVDALGLDCLAVIEQNPGALAVPGVTRARAAAIARSSPSSARRRRRWCPAAARARAALAQRVWKVYRERTVAQVREDPWRLADDVFGIGFRTADALARQLGHAAEAPARLRAGLRHLLGQAAQDGHCGMPREEFLQAAAPFLEVDEALVTEALGRARPRARGRRSRLPARSCARPRSSSPRAMRRLLGCDAPLTTLARTRPSTTAARARLELAPDQRQALGTRSARASRCSRAGRARQDDARRCLIDVRVAQGRRVALAAPTGRAARRLAEATGRDASTLHRLLGLLPAGGGFRVERTEPLALDVLIVDETSMVDIALMAAVIQALPPEAGLILVGDVDQLPSVGPGEVLRSLIQRLVPVARLTTIFQQARDSGIVQVAHELNAGEVPAFDEGRTGRLAIERQDAGRR